MIETFRQQGVLVRTQGFEYAVASASGSISSGPAELLGVVVKTVGTLATLTVFDNASAASGETPIPLTAAFATLGQGFSVGGFGQPVRMQNGIYVSLGGTGGAVYVIYRKL